MEAMTIDTRGLQVLSSDEICFVSGGDAFEDVAGGEIGVGGALGGYGAYFGVAALVGFGSGLALVGGVALIGYGIYQYYH
jgi:hypothetical protein